MTDVGFSQFSGLTGVTVCFHSKTGSSFQAVFAQPLSGNSVRVKPLLAAASDEHGLGTSFKKSSLPETALRKGTRTCTCCQDKRTLSQGQHAVCSDFSCADRSPIKSNCHGPTGTQTGWAEAQVWNYLSPVTERTPSVPPSAVPGD